VVPVIGDIGDRKFLDHLFREHRPELIFHAAAYKHVPLMERNPFSAIANNAIGTHTLAGAAVDAGVSKLIAISTDKAVNPRSVMGASKRIAEQIVLAYASSEARMNAVRLGNVLGSAGSVAPIFQEQAEKGLPLTVTHADAERYFITQAEAEAAMLRAAGAAVWGRVLVPDCGELFHIVDLARYVADRCQSGSGSQIEFIGIRPGDKMREELVSEDEVVESESSDRMRVVVSPVPTSREMEAAIKRLQAAVDDRDHAGLIAAVCELVPEYQPANGKIGAATAMEAG
jgi:FlaA1/EpsC-like NDP-sugar epimerase